MGMPGDMMTLGCCILLPSWQEVSVFLGTAREEQPARTGRGSRPLMDRRPCGGRFWSQRMGAESLKCGVAGARATSEGTTWEVRAQCGSSGLGFDGEQKRFLTVGVEKREGLS